ncbi:MAG: tRNA adenosine(34) deaminase TadA [Deltaproteobacteria bacterium]|nr:tRNA adenosine(34) deaminase TadA [Deltaproteobacteria bacterium]
MQDVRSRKQKIRRKKILPITSRLLPLASCNLQLDTYFMSEALKEAKKAVKKGEVPIGAVIVSDNNIIARGYNLKESAADPTSHAEIIAIKKASKKLGEWRLLNSTIYVTLEPCLMCMGALIQARISRLVFGCYDSKAGAAGSLYDVSNDKRLNHRIKLTTGVMTAECEKILKDFFRDLRR